MTLFRNVVFVAAIAGLLAGIVMTAMQAYATVPLILQAETFENAEAAPVHDHAAPADTGAATTPEAAAPAAHEHGEEAWTPADGFERYAYTAAANVVTGNRLRADPGGRFGSLRWHPQLAPGPVLGFCRLCRVHAGSRPRPAAGTACNACRRSRGAAGLVDRHCCRHRDRTGADRLPPLGAACHSWPRADRRAAYHRRAAARKP